MQGQLNINYPKILEGIISLVNPVYNDILGNLKYYWTIHKSEWATDILFNSPIRKSVADIYRRSKVSQSSNERYLEALSSLNTNLPINKLVS